MMNTTTLRTFIQNRLDQHIQKHKALSRDFFESIELKNTIKSDISMFNLSDDKFESIYSSAIKECRHEEQQSMSPSASLLGDAAKKRNWLTPERVNEIGWNNDDIKTYRGRYIDYLSKIGRSESYIDETKRSSFEIVKKLGDPKDSNQFYVRGLVVGSVQSGKTANFNAVINSAVDAGYGLIIVLSGIMEDLRKQTQRRIEKEVEGRLEKDGKFIGVGEISSFGPQGVYSDVHQVVVPTSTETDFKKSMKESNFTLNNNNILICKKNTGVLKNLILWLNNYLNVNKDKITIPLLIVDDEADNASLNNLGVKGVNYASTINRHIRTLLGLFHKRTYVGYTATPFANVLQDRNAASKNKWMLEEKKADGQVLQHYFDQVDSLFPNDFIELLFPPSNYIGAKHFFETKLDDVKKITPLVSQAVDDFHEAFPLRVLKESGLATTDTGTKTTRGPLKEDLFPTFLPRSLKDAVMCFVISTAIRISRKSVMIDSKFYQPHNTMLIHISRFTTWQTRTKTLVKEYVNELKSRLDNDFPSDKNSIYGLFEKIWNKHYAYVIENIRNYLPGEYNDNFLIPKTFESIKPFLVMAINDIEVKAVNSEKQTDNEPPTQDTLEYIEGTEKKYIAIGGNRLSRGFTLEGLTVNYFLRSTNLADTLLQMGRWFGYRPGYLDCCKLFTTAESLNKFDQTTVTIEDLEQKFIDMNRNPLNTPETYALRVLNHPGVLKLTRNSILKNTNEVKISYSDHLIQTTKLIIDKTTIEQAWADFNSHINKLKDRLKVVKNATETKIEYLVFEPSNVDEIFEFFRLRNAFDSSGPDLDEVERYIRECNKNKKLKDWSVLIKGTGDGDLLDIERLNFPFKLKMALRGAPPKGRWRAELETNAIYSPGGGSSNILTGGKDLKYRLSEPEIEKAESEFKDNKFIQLKKENPYLSDEHINKKVDRINIPEKVYRHKMTDKEGILVIYLMDLDKVFKSKEKEIPELAALKERVDTSVPLIGYVIGIPPVRGDIGGVYVQSKYHDKTLELEEFDDFEEMNEVLEL